MPRPRLLVCRASHAPRAIASVAGWIALVASLILPVSALPVHAAAAGPTLTPSVPSGQPVGTTVAWTAASGASGAPVYRFSAGLAGGSLRVLRDFSLSDSFSWTPLQEGTYEIAVTAKAAFTATGGTTTAVSFVVTSRITGAAAVVSPTANPLVALYSAPACDVGQMVVQFRPSASSDAGWASTSAQPCQPGLSRNVLVAGMLPETSYLLRSVISTPAGSITSFPSSFTTGAPPATLQFPTVTVPMTPSASSDQNTPLVIHLLTPNQPDVPNPLATNLDGQVVWYYDASQSGLSAVWPVNIDPGGTTLLFGRDAYRAVGDDVLREVDLAGDPVQETNIDAINAQLAARGQDPIYSLHHDALRLPDGDIAVLGMTQRTINGQDVVGDLLIVLNIDLQVTWVWNPFDHLDPSRAPILGETCSAYGAALCAVPDPQAEDWLHTNSIGWSPTDHDLVLSFRHQDWVIKIDYRDGHGHGAIVWRLGQDGDFTITDPDPSDADPWFSHQHNAYYINNTTLLLFDDGDTRCAASSASATPCDSRGQVLALDERHRTATLLLNANLGTYSLALGSAQALPNGNYAFGAGAQGASLTGQLIEVDPQGTPVYVQQVSTAEYRAYRVGALDQGTPPARAACATAVPCTGGDPPAAQSTRRPPTPGKGMLRT